MATNGGTLHQGLPPTSSRINLNCAQCGVMLDTVESLNVHNMHYHSDHINRWGPPGNGGGAGHKSTASTASNSPTDSENNNHQPKHNIHNIHASSKSGGSPLNNTVSAAADSSDNQPTTTQPPSTAGQEPRLIYGGYGMSNAPTTFGQHQQTAAEQPHFQPYMSQYDQYYHFHNLEYGMPPPPFLNSQPPSQQEYKPVPSNRYHPYINHTLNPTHPNAINSAVSPRNVSSSSPTHNANVMQQSTTASPSNQLIPTSQPTPSPSPNQCDKCGQICETASQLGEHYATAHNAGGHNEPNRNSGANENGELPAFPYNHYIKEEQPCDILDLDSQKMVYSPNDEHSQQGPLPPMHSLHHLQRPLLWSHDHHGLPYPQDMKPVLFPPSLPPKQEFSPNVIKQEYIHHQPQLGHPQDVKQFNSDVVSGGQVTSSPSEFPSTTTPQENGAQSQFRTSFEAATSSLPTNAATGKSSSWKSNEARRPKTYNCTACNKWFTSSGHLKRHYNTTLHKNAVKSSGQPDPATMPISIHHHPARDATKNNHHHRGSPAQAQQPPQPPSAEQSGSPEYNSQYTPPLGFQQPQGFQQYGSTPLAIHSTTGSSPNGQAGPSVLASQPRGLLILLNNTGTQQVLPEEEQQQIFMPQITQSHITNSPDPYSITNRTTINTNTITTELSPDIQDQEQLHQNYLTITGNGLDDTSNEMITLHQVDYGTMMPTENDDQSHVSYQSAVPRDVRRYLGGDPEVQSARRFSPDIAESYRKFCRPDPMSPKAGAIQPQSPLAETLSPITTCSSTESETPPVEVTTVHRCGPCDKVFNKACYLTQHNKTFHSGEKPYKCHKCGKRFPCGQSHEEHIAKHGAEKPFKCDQCVKSFNHKTDLRRHMCLHTGSKPYSCMICNKGFIRKDHMMKHTETHTRKSAMLAKKHGIFMK